MLQRSTDQLHVVDETVAVLPGLLSVAVQVHRLDILDNNNINIQVHRLDILDNNNIYSTAVMHTKCNSIM